MTIGLLLMLGLLLRGQVGIGLASAKGGDVLGPIQQTVQRGPLTATVELDRGETNLVDPLTLTVQIEAREPIEVLSIPDPILQPESAEAWWITPLTPETTEPNRWRRCYRLEAFAWGDAVPIRLLPCSVRMVRTGQTIPWTDWPVFHVRVTSSIDRVSLADVGPISDPPPLPESVALQETLWSWPALGMGLVIGGSLVFVMLRRRRHRAVPELSADEWALQQLRAVPLDASDAIAEVDRIFRQWLERCFGIPALRRTPAEMQAEWHRPGNGTATDAIGSDVIRFLTTLEQVKFAPHHTGMPPKQLRDWAIQMIEAHPADPVK